MLKEIIGLQIIALILGAGLDILVGDPHGWPHLVIVFGKVISLLEKGLIKLNNKKLAGSILVILELIICIGSILLILILGYIVSPYLFVVMEMLLNWQCLAMKSLKDESLKVFRALKSGDLEQSRKAVSMIVGRDTNMLDREGITKAAVETVAENASDGVAAPLFYMLIFGAVGGVIYKAINTMDSMIGYKNEKYYEFGRCAAKLDDAVNFLPSRICAVVMIFASRLLSYDYDNAFKIWKRDRFNHASPNSAQTESAMAGALDIKLAGNAFYFGKLVEKPYIGDSRRPIEDEDIIRSHYLLYATSFLLFGLLIIIRGIIYVCL